ncbi:YoaK family protein [Bosea sp. RAF48]|uniref:YoaK family protein n=1 Tax=Bosea sp. RAF48 TaxID=3237480 RepID=UPI003F91407C
MKFPSLPIFLSLNGGYIDTLGFLSLSGLFTAHVTGNFVTLGATAALGLSGALSKVLALPMFCVVVFVSRLICLKLQSMGRSPIKPMLVVKLALLAAVAIYALSHGPFQADGNVVTLVVGLALVSAMAIQNGLHRAHLPKASPSTLMTGTTTQIMLDLADLLAGSKAEEVATTKARVKKMAAAVVTFALGCGFGAAGYMFAPAAAFSLPAVLAAVALFASTAGAEAN